MLDSSTGPCQTGVWSLRQVLKKYAALYHCMGYILAGLVVRGQEGQSPDKEAEDAIMKGLYSLRRLLGDASLKLSLKELNRVLEDCEQDGLVSVMADPKQRFHVLEERVIDELESIWLKHVPKPELYRKINPFGIRVTERFPSSILDIEEASKCLALERGTACVFHLGRATERVMHEWLGILKVAFPPDRSWQATLNEVNRAVDSMPTATEPERTRKSEMHQAATNLYNVKHAWRNNVMHPRESYTPEEAEEVYGAAKSLLRHLAKLI